MSRTAHRAIALAGTIWLVAGCGVGGQSTKPLVFPNAARAGDTVALTIDTNYATVTNFLLFEDLEDYGYSSENITGVRVSQSGTEWTQTPRAVFSAQVPPLSIFEGTNPGSWVTVLLFDLPTGLVPGTAATLVPLVDGADIIWSQPPFSQVWSVKVLEGVGATTNFLPSEAQLEARPMVRLRVREATGAFYDGISVGAMEFDIVFPSSVENPEVRTNSEAASGFAMVGTPVEVAGSGGTQFAARVVLIDPSGLTLTAPSGTTQAVLGQGPIVDIAFDRLSPFQVADFEIRNLYVTDAQGVDEFDRRGEGAPYSTDLFDVVAVNGGS